MASVPRRHAPWLIKQVDLLAGFAEAARACQFGVLLAPAAALPLRLNGSPRLAQAAKSVAPHQPGRC